jgi:hypothetical protein
MKPRLRFICEYNLMTTKLVRLLTPACRQAGMTINANYNDQTYIIDLLIPSHAKAWLYPRHPSTNQPINPTPAKQLNDNK